MRNLDVVFSFNRGILSISALRCRGFVVNGLVYRFGVSREYTA